MYNVFGVFKKKEEAVKAFKELLYNGYELTDVSVIYNKNLKSLDSDSVTGDYVRHKLSRVGISGDIVDIYGKKIEEGGIFLSAPVGDEHELGLVTVILDDNNADQIRVSGDWRLSNYLVRR